MNGVVTGRYFIIENILVKIAKQFIRGFMLVKYKRDDSGKNPTLKFCCN